MKKKYLIYISIVVVFVLSAVLFSFQNREMEAKYNEALSYAQKSDYETARNILYDIGEYKDADALAKRYNNEVGYLEGMDYYKKGDYTEALKIFESLAAAENGGFKDSADFRNEIRYKKAMELARSGDIDNARVEFKNLPISYKDVTERMEQINFLKNVIDLWYCSDHQIDMDITGYLSDENIPYVNVEIKDRYGFLLGTENNKLIGGDIVLDEDRFVWDMFSNGVKYVGQLIDNEFKISKLADGEEANVVNFVRKFEIYNEIDGNMDASVDRDVDAGVK